MTAELGLTISDTSAETVFSELKRDVQFLDKTFEAMRRENKQLHRFIKKEKNNFVSSRIYQYISILTYAAITQELKIQGKDIKISPEKIEQHLSYQQTINHQQDTDIVDFFHKVNQKSPVFVGKLNYVVGSLPLDNNQKSAFYCAIFDVSKIFGVDEGV